VRTKIALWSVLADAFTLLSLMTASAVAQAQIKETSRARETIHVGIIDRTFFFQPIVVAIQNGYFADEGLNANMRFIRSGEGQAEGLLKGDLHFALSSVEGILHNVERGGPLRLLAANSGKLSHFIVTQSKFKKVEDLKGATVGILTLTEGSFFNWQEIALRHGLKYPDDYRVMQTAGAGARHRLLLEGKIDAGLQSIPWAYVGEDAGLNNLGAAVDYVPDWQFTTYNVNGEWAKSNAAKAEGFLRAILRATDWIYRHRSESAEIAARELSIKPAYAERAWDYYTQTGTLTRDLAFSAPGLRKVFDAQIKAGLLPASRTFDVSRYVAGGYLERARATVVKD
jgi:ABC-type nitrate/sulfonate/bicarbonate transport system substrate-binding protein